MPLLIRFLKTIISITPFSSGITHQDDSKIYLDSSSVSRTENFTVDRKNQQPHGKVRVVSGINRLGLSQLFHIHIELEVSHDSSVVKLILDDHPWSSSEGGR